MKTNLKEYNLIFRIDFIFLITDKLPYQFQDLVTQKQKIPTFTITSVSTKYQVCKL